MYSYRDEKGGVELTVVYASDQAEKQNAQVDTFIGQGVDAIILQPGDKAALVPAVEAAKKAGIPLITVNTKTENQDQALAFSGCDDIQSGELQMERICKQLGGKGSIAILQGNMGNPAQIGRYQGYKNILAKYPEVKMVYEQSGEWQTDKAQQITENWLENETKLDAILCHCDSMAVGVLNALNSKGMTGKVLVAGMDCLTEVMDAIGKGTIDNSIWQDGVGQGYAAVDLAVKASNGEKVSDFIIPYEVCCKDNLQDYLKKAEVRDALTKKYF
jgi:inositol transport system substrate-binding protein